MLLNFVSGVLAIAGTTFAKEVAKDAVKAEELYDSGVRHEAIMSMKHATWDRLRAAGALNSSQYPEIVGPVLCKDGVAQTSAGEKFRCKNADLYHFLSHNALGSNGGEGSSSWGWTSPDGREFIAIGQSDGAAFAEISKEGKLVYLGRLPQYSTPVIWREIRGYNDFMVIGSEAQGHNIQIFDMKRLLNVSSKNPVTFDKKADGLFTGLPIGRTHNVVTNPESGWAYSVGAQPRNSSCRSGLIFIDMKDPYNPTSGGCAPQDGYVHDAQCVIYRGPDTRYQGKEICYGYNEDSLTIYDVSDKKKPTIISNTSYEGASYTHQGWVLDPQWQTHLLLDDEYDEYDAKGPGAEGYPVTYIWDITDLQHPKETGTFINRDVKSIDHNQYVHNGRSYQSNYGSGFRVLDVSSIPQDPTGKGIKEVAFFDVHPEDDEEEGGGIIDFVGSWSSYALFKSGYIFVNTIERGGFVVKLTV